MSGRVVWMSRTQKFLMVVLICAVAACSDEVTIKGVAVAEADAGAAGRVAGAGNAGPLEQVQALATAYCTRLLACQPHEFAIDYPDLTVCVARESLRVQASLGAPGAKSSVEILSSCAKQVATAACDAVRYGGPPRCFFTAGSRANGQPCAWDSQCQGKVCYRKSGGTCGLCASEGKFGDTCSPRTCEAGITCALDTGSNNYRCRAGAKAGEPCNSNVKQESMCGYGLTCVAGKCAPAAGLGAPCGEIGCDHDLGHACHKETKVCTAIAMGGPGATCSLAAIGHDLYKECNDGLCLNRNDRGNGKCVAYAADGAACEGWTGPLCRVPAMCLQGKCKVLTGTECP